MNCSKLQSTQHTRLSCSVLQGVAMRDEDLGDEEDHKDAEAQTYVLCGSKW